MAKSYYTVDEAMAKLGVTDDGIKDLVRDGKLREFRDAGKIHFKTDDIDKLAPEMGGGPSAESSLPGLALADEGESLADSSVGDRATGDREAGDREAGDREDSGEITLEPVEDLASASGSGSAIGLSPEDSAGDSDAGDSDAGDSDAGDSDAGASDAGVSDAGASDAGLISLEDSRAGLTDEVTLDDSTSQSNIRKDDTIISGTGVSVFDEKQLESEADPAADTVLTASASDQVALEGIGSGSGLLDLTREADDTSLGAELLDEIQPGGSETRLDDDEPVEADVAAAETSEIADSPAYRPLTAAVVVDDPYAPAFTGAMVVAMVTLTLAGAVAGAFVQGTWPSYLQTIYTNFWIAFGGSFGVAALVLGVGYFMCRSKANR